MAYKLPDTIIRRNLLALPLVCLGWVQSFSQNVSSPYSILGIGDIDTKDYGRYFGSGNASLARRDAGSYNFSNPASLTALSTKTMNFDISMRGRSSRFGSPSFDTLTGTTKDFIVKRITLAIGLSQRSGLAIGLRPYSSVNYQYSSEDIILDGVTPFVKNIQGHGGLNQAYLSYGHRLGKRFSVGLTGTALFGQSIKETTYEGNSLELLVQKKETKSYYGSNLQAGLQFSTLAKRKWQHSLGLTTTLGSVLHGQTSLEYFENDQLLTKTVEDAEDFKLPVSAGIGYTATYRNKLNLSAEANYYHWAYQKVDYTRSYTYPSARFSLGMEYSKKITYRNWSDPNIQRQIERWHLGWGLSAENSYIRINGQNMWDYSLSLGAGYNILNGVSLYSGLEFGRKGNLSLGQFRERYTQYILGITLKEIWLGPRYTHRYN